MILHNLKIAYRNILRNKGYSFLNIFGLAIGMACTILLLLWANREMSFDKFHENTDNLYTIVHWPRDGAQDNIPGILVDKLKDELPEITHASNYVRWGANYLVSYEGKKRYFSIQAADSEFFKMFSFPLVRGDINTVLDDDNSLIITQRIATKLFGSDDPMGKSVLLNNKELHTVTAVIEDLPSNSSIRFDILVPFKKLREEQKWLRSWYNNSHKGFVQIDKNADMVALNKKLQTFYKDNVDPEVPNRLSLQPISDMHLYKLNGTNGRILTVRLYFVIAIFILLIACFNFINLSTAQASKRAKEIGLKKAIGSRYSQLVFQFIGESMFLTFIAANFAVVMARLFLPEFNNILNCDLELDYSSVEFIVVLLTIIFTTGLLAGIYPAFYLSSFKPVQVLKGVNKSGKKGNIFRKILLVFQYTLTSSLLIFTIVVSLQTYFVANKDIGLSLDNVIHVPLNQQILKNKKLLKEQLQSNVSVKSVSYTSNVPYSVYSNGWGYEWEGKDPKSDPLITRLLSDEDFIKTFKVEMAQGRFFETKDINADSKNVIINETFAKMISKESVVGKTIKQGQNYTIIGVVKDFNCVSVERANPPLIIFGNENFFNLFVRYEEGQLKSAMDHVSSMCNKYSPDFPVSLNVLHDEYENMFKSSKRSLLIFVYSSILAIIIACLGLFGLTSFMAEERTKEFGVRKVLGASVTQLSSIFIKEFSKWIAVSTVIAWPLSYFVIDAWFQIFAYRIDMPYYVFVAIPLLIFIISLITIAYQSWKSATANPVKSLKCE